MSKAHTLAITIGHLLLCSVVANDKTMANKTSPIEVCVRVQGALQLKLTVSPGEADTCHVAAEAGTLKVQVSVRYAGGIQALSDDLFAGAGSVVAAIGTGEAQTTSATDRISYSLLIASDATHEKIEFTISGSAGVLHRRVANEPRLHRALAALMADLPKMYQLAEKGGDHRAVLPSAVPDQPQK